MVTALPIRLPDVNTPLVLDASRFNVEVSRDVIEATTFADTFGSVDGLIIDTAYNVYATGVGNVLGPCEVRNGTTSETVTLSYQWNGADITATDLQSAWDTAQSTATTIHWTQGTGFIYINDNRYPLDGRDVAVAFPTVTSSATNTVWPPPVPETAEQVAARKAKDARWEVVKKRADALWLGHLTDAERALWLAKGYVEVLSQRGRRYRIKNFGSGNVALVVNGQEVRSYCAYGIDVDRKGLLPMGDHWFVQMMALRFDEDAFLKAANTWDLTVKNRPFVGQGVDARQMMEEAAA